MTPQEKVAAWARSQVGYRADSGKHNKYAAKLDALGFVYNGAKNGYDWCDVFADSAYIECFGADLALKMIHQPRFGCGAGCPYSADYYRAAGAFESAPSLGAQIFFGTPGDEYHTGIVVDWSSGSVLCVEGNVGGGNGRVDYRSHARYGGDISGYGVPDWSLAGGSHDSKPSGGYPSFDLYVDGDFGSVTCRALQAALQYHGYYGGYLLDGDFGYYTKLEMQRYLRSLGYYGSGYLLDGDFGYYSTLALQKYLRALGFNDSVADGYWGSFTTKALQRALNAKRF